MQGRLERSIENAVVEWATRHGILALKLNTWGNNGWPDRQFLKNGKVLFIEFKKPGEGAEPLQVVRHDRLRALGFEVQIHDDKHAAIAALDAALLSGGSG